MNNDPGIIFTIEGNLLLMYSWKVSENTYSPMNEYLKEPRYLSEFAFIPMLVWQQSHVHPKVSPVLQHDTEHITITSIVQLYQSSEIPVTPKASQNALLGSDALLKLSLLSFHSTSTHTLLEAHSN
jgi:hypothetical protein